MSKQELQAGAQVEEVAITPEMIQAGASVLRASGRLPWNVEDWAAEELARDVFRAMNAPAPLGQDHLVDVNKVIEEGRLPYRENSGFSPSPSSGKSATTSAST